MTTDDELRKLIALGEKATARPWNCDTQLGNVEPYTDEHEIGVYDGVDHEDYGYDANGIRHQASIGFCYSDSDGEDALNNAAYITAAANLAPEIAAELIAAREEIQRLRRSLESIANLGLQVLPVDKRWGTAFAFAKDALKGGDV